MIPSDIPALCTVAQGRMLQEYAKDKTVLEAGSYCGFSTICMAQFAKIVYSIEVHTGEDRHAGPKIFQIFINNLTRYRVLDKVAILRGYTYDILPRLTPQMFDMAFIDATHTYEAVAQDIDLTLPLLRPREGRHVGALIAFHDYHEPLHPGSTIAIDEYIAAGTFKPIDEEGTLLVCRLP